MQVVDLPRVVPLEGASNVRDLGGYPVAGGGRVRFGKVFRAAALSRLTPADAQTLREAGVRVVCDLRGAVEREKAPSALPGVETHALMIEPSLGASLRDIAARHEATVETVTTVMQRAYAAYALDWAHRYRTLFALLAADDARPTLFHCTAGKDRTGFGAALILRALGAGWDVVMEDYLATNRLWQGDSELAAMLPPSVAEILLRVEPSFLEAAFAAIETAHGSFDLYLESAMGLDAAARERLHARLVE